MNNIYILTALFLIIHSEEPKNDIKLKAKRTTGKNFMSQEITQSFTFSGGEDKYNKMRKESEEAINLLKKEMESQVSNENENINGFKIEKRTQESNNDQNPIKEETITLDKE